MQRLFRAGKLIHPGHSLHGQAVAIRVEDGIITAIAPDLEDGQAKVYNYPNASVSIGWLDLETEAGDPGVEHREDISSLARSAMKGGYTHIGVRPHADPCMHDKSGVGYLLQQSKESGVTMLPLGAITRDLAGKDITEMLDMRASGALAFTDGHHSLQHAGVMLRALLYVKSFDGLVMNQPLEAGIAAKGHLHEGLVSTTLGMRGIPALAEELMVERDLHLLAYTDSRLHLSHISTAGAVARIRQAKAKGLQVTASVAALNLLGTVEDLRSFDSHYKVLPPLREEEDRLALIEGLKDGTIDCISSNHCPRELEAKHLEFAYADFGAVMLSTSFGTLSTALQEHLEESKIIDLLTKGPREVLGIPMPQLTIGEKAELSFYNYEESWQPERADIGSKSKNAPLLGRQLKGRPIGIVNGTYLSL